MRPAEELAAPGANLCDTRSMPSKPSQILSSTVTAHSMQSQGSLGPMRKGSFQPSGAVDSSACTDESTAAAVRSVLCRLAPLAWLVMSTY